MTFHIERTLRLLGILGILSMTSCVDMGETVQKGSDAEKNLAAIRELLKPVDGRGPSPSRRLEGDTSGDTHGALQNLNEDLSPSDVRSTNSNYIPLSSPFMARSKGSIHSGQTQVYIPWRPSTPKALEITEPFRPVPPYLTTMPAVPDALGPVRCSPDFSGGQRCH
jgi:hypothetical protein